MSKYGVKVDLHTGEIGHEPIREILDQDDADYWLKLFRHIEGSRCDYELKFYSLADENPALQRTPVNLKYLVHTMYLRLTERIIMVMRVLYERDVITLEELRTTIMNEIDTDQEMGRRVRRLARTRLAGQPIVPGEPTRDGFIPSDTVDAMGRTVGIHSSTLPLSHPFKRFQEIMNTHFPVVPKMPFPEFGAGDQYRYVKASQRFLCVKHRKGICKPCNIDLAGCKLINEDIPGHKVLRVMQRFRGDDDTHTPVESSERAFAYPTKMVTDSLLNLTYNENDPQSAALCTLGDTVRYVPQWDPTIVGKDEANSNKHTSGGNIPDTLLPISDVASKYCVAKECQVTWQAAKASQDDLLMRHPSHHTAIDRINRAKRTMIVHVDGILVQATGTTPARAGVGVFFGKNSVYNTSKRFERRQLSHNVFPEDARNRDHPGVALNQTTPVYAAVVDALQRLRLQIFPAREALVEKHGQRISGHAARDALRFRVIVVTKSKELIDSLAAINDTYTIGTLNGQAFTRAKDVAKAKARARKKRSGKGKGQGQAEGSQAAGSTPTSTSPTAIEGNVDWDKFTPTEGDEKIVVFGKQTGSVIANSDGIVAVMRETAMLNILGVTVEYYLQPAKANLAESLAKGALVTE